MQLGVLQNLRNSFCVQTPLNLILSLLIGGKFLPLVLLLFTRFCFIKTIFLGTKNSHFFEKNSKFSYWVSMSSVAWINHNFTVNRKKIIILLPTTAFLLFHAVFFGFPVGCQKKCSFFCPIFFRETVNTPHKICHLP